jgi:hypothetical protein
MLPHELEMRSKALELISTVLQSRGALPPAGQTRLLQIARLFGAEREPTLVPTAVDEMDDQRRRSSPFRSSTSTEQKQGLTA